MPHRLRPWHQGARPLLGNPICELTPVHKSRARSCHRSGLQQVGRPQEHCLLRSVVDARLAGTSWSRQEVELLADQATSTDFAPKPGAWQLNHGRFGRHTDWERYCRYPRVLELSLSSGGRGAGDSKLNLLGILHTSKKDSTEYLGCVRGQGDVVRGERIAASSGLRRPPVAWNFPKDLGQSTWPFHRKTESPGRHSSNRRTWCRNSATTASSKPRAAKTLELARPPEDRVDSAPVQQRPVPNTGAGASRR